jgi:hypothetical protein
MPCSDVTEVIEVILDEQDRLKEYTFRKRTCGQGVGVGDLLQGILGGMPAEDVLAITPEYFLETWPVEDSLEEFLGLKHLIAVQSALEVLLGKASGGPGELCAAAEIGCEGNDTVILARISVDLITEKIKSCGNCKGCGTSRRAKRMVVFN